MIESYFLSFVVYYLQMRAYILSSNTPSSGVIHVDHRHEGSRRRRLSQTENSIATTSTTRSETAPVTIISTDGINRLLEDVGDDAANDDESSSIDLSSYYLQFNRCQVLQVMSNSYNNNAGDDDADAGDDYLYYDDGGNKKYGSFTLKETRVVTYRLCASPNNCQSKNYGEFMVDLDTYVSATANYYSSQLQDMCTDCQSYCNNDDQFYQRNRNMRSSSSSSIDCTTCLKECNYILNMEANGYVEATDYVGCQFLYQDKSSGGLYYSGPICSGNNNGDSSNSHVSIGVYTDQYCTNLDENKHIDDYLFNDDGSQVRLSHVILKKIYDGEQSISCNYNVNNNDDNNNQKGNDDYMYGYYDDGNADQSLCDAIYYPSAKCQMQHGFQGDSTKTKSYSTSQYQQQRSITNTDEEEVNCSFIQSVNMGTFDSDGYIRVGKNIAYDINDSGYRNPVTVQRRWLWLLGSGVVGLLMAVVYLKRKMSENHDKSPLIRREGNIA